MMDRSVPNYRAIMIKYDVDNYPRFDLPEGFYITGYKPGYEKQWAEIECVQQCMESPEKAEAVFRLQIATVSYERKFVSLPRSLRFFTCTPDTVPTLFL